MMTKMEIDANTKFVTFWRITITMEGKHVLTPTTYKDLFFKTREAVDRYMDSVPEKARMWCDVTEVLAVKLVRPGRPDTFYPLEKPLLFQS